MKESSKLSSKAIANEDTHRDESVNDFIVTVDANLIAGYSNTINTLNNSNSIKITKINS